MNPSVLHTLNAGLLFLCTSMYLGTAWSLVLFSFPIAPQLTVDTYYLHFVPQVAAATRFLTWMTLVMLVAAVVLFLAERKGPLRWYPAIVFLAMVAATLFTQFLIVPYNAEMASGTVQWLAMMGYFTHKLLWAEQPARVQVEKPAPKGPSARRWVGVRS